MRKGQRGGGIAGERPKKMVERCIRERETGKERKKVAGKLAAIY